MNEKQAKSYSVSTLAFLGDAVYEQLVREQIVRMGDLPVGKAHDIKAEKSRAAYQSAAVENILPALTEDETAVYRRGRNFRGKVPKSAKTMDYRRATGLECLFGYLHLCGNHDRKNELFARIWDSETEGG